LIITSACETTEILRENPVIIPNEEFYWYAEKGKNIKDRLVREFDWISDSYSRTIIDEHNRPLANYGFFCGERIY
jgi:hypothetical protein